jgi:hypothetical protein
MSKNYIRLEVGGKEQGLKFNMGTLKHLKDITGGDPFSFFIGEDIEAQIKQVAVILCAAMMANYRSKKQEVDFTLADCELWSEDLSMEEALRVVNTFRAAYMPEVSGEGNDDTRAQTPIMAGSDGDSAGGVIA